MKKEVGFQDSELDSRDSMVSVPILLLLLLPTLLLVNQVPTRQTRPFLSTTLNGWAKVQRTNESRIKKGRDPQSLARKSKSHNTSRNHFQGRMPRVETFLASTCSATRRDASQSSNTASSERGNLRDVIVFLAYALTSHKQNDKCLQGISTMSYQTHRRPFFFLL